MSEPATQRSHSVQNLLSLILHLKEKRWGTPIVKESDFAVSPKGENAVILFIYRKSPVTSPQSLYKGLWKNTTGFLTSTMVCDGNCFSLPSLRRPCMNRIKPTISCETCGSFSFSFFCTYWRWEEEIGKHSSFGRWLSRASWRIPFRCFLMGAHGTFLGFLKLHDLEDYSFGLIL